MKGPNQLSKTYAAICDDYEVEQVKISEIDVCR